MYKKEKSGKTISVEDVIKKIEMLNEEEPSAPVMRRYRSNDATIEKIGELLRENPTGLLILRDELVGLLASWEKAGHEGDRTFFLEAWNGYGSFDSDRIGRGTIPIPNLCLSVFGGIQPDKLRAILELIAGALANDGTLQRFQMLVYPDIDQWEYRDRHPDKAARDKVYDLFERLADFDPVALGASPADDFNKFPHFRFSPEAQEVYIKWATQLHTEKLPAEDNQLIVQHLIKYEKLFPALALILHIVDCLIAGASGPVSKQAALRAAEWCEYLESHARRCYGLLAGKGAYAAQRLAEQIQRGHLKNGFTTREVYRPQWSGLKTPEDAQAALDWLEDAHWLRSIPVESGYSGGRPTRTYQINPKVQHSGFQPTPETRPVKTDTTPVSSV